MLPNLEKNPLERGVLQRDACSGLLFGGVGGWGGVLGEGRPL